MSASDNEEYTIPLQDKRAFGAGIKRKCVQFVRSSDSTTTTDAPTTSSGPSASDFYLNLVLPRVGTKASGKRQYVATSVVEDEKELPQELSEVRSEANNSRTGATLQDSSQALICGTCRLPRDTSSSTTPHQALLAHQLSLPHSHPPSSLSRSHPGLRILQSQGWDPDSRLGLGATGGGIRFPIKAKEKGDKMGVGAKTPQPRKGDAEVSRAVQEARIKKKKEDERKKKGKGWLKKQVEQERRRGDKLKDMFYGSEEMDKHLKG